MRLARVGIETVKGFLDGGVEAWSKAGLDVEAVPQITVADLHELLTEKKDLQVIDVRRPPEYQSGHVPGAVTAPLSVLERLIPNLKLNPAKQTAVICAGGYRSSAGTSLLEQHGFKDLLNVTGGTNAWLNAGYPVEVPPQSD
jgi:hydroxyacylglutathione hydrolase